VSLNRSYQHALTRRQLTNPLAILTKHVAFLLMISLLMSLGCATVSTQTPTIVRPECNIEWNKVIDQKVTGYQLTVINQDNPEENTVLFIPAETTKVSCRNAGAGHEGLWGVTVQSCYDTSTCGSPTDVIRMRIVSK
jgi:hypothetical protein